MTNKRKSKNLRAYRDKVKQGKSESISRRLDYLMVGVAALVIVFVGSFALRFTLGESSPAVKKPIFLRFQVLNGCGVTGAAAKFSKYITERSQPDFIIDVIDEGNFKSFNQEKTLVIVRDAGVAEAEKFADMVGLPREQVIYKELKDNFLDIHFTLVVGKDFNTFLKETG